MSFFSKLKESIAGNPDELMQEAEESEYVELGKDSQGDDKKIVVRSFTLKDFESIKEILSSLREGQTVALINIKPLKDKDIVELKRAISKLKKTIDAIDGDIAGLGEDFIAAVPSFGRIERQTKKSANPRPAESSEVTEYSSAAAESDHSDPENPSDAPTADGEEELRIEPY